MTVPLAPTTESRRDRLARRAREDLEQLARDGQLPVDPGMEHDRSSEPAGPRRDPLERYRKEREAEELANRTAAFWGTGLEDAIRARPTTPRDPNFQMPLGYSEPPAPAERPIGPGPTYRGGVRHYDPNRAGSAANPTFEQMETAFDPFNSESQLVRSLAQLRYKSAAAPLVFGPGQTVAKLLFRGYDALHALPWEKLGPVGDVVDKGLGALEQDLGTRIARDEAAEYVVRERHMSPLERALHDLTRFGVEYELAAGAAPFLKAAPILGATPEGAGLGTRLVGAARRIGARATLQGAQFGAYEQAKSLLAPRLLKIPRRERSQ